ncbi:MAG: Gldg family protein, partial [Candidatus Omnitrophica bacterium]|nr:Gldg family protein [Candidatus Omnitrophota bacterium]
RELCAYFNSPIAYIFIIVFVLLTCGIFMSEFFLLGNANMRAFFVFLPIVLCIFIPAVTMRIWAEEKNGNTFELLLTFPMKTSQLVLGKFAAGFVFYLITLAGTIFVPIMLFMIGKPDIGPIIGGYLGAIFIGAFFLSIGIFVSGLCRDQIVAFIGAMMVCFFFYLSGLDFIAGVIDGWINGAGSFLKEYFGMTRHFTSFAKGVVDGKDVLYFLIMITLFLSLNVFSLEDRMRPKAKLFFSGAVLISLGIAVAINFIFADITAGRYDLTQGKLYTVTSASKNILRDLKSPVKVKLYISPQEKMPTAFKTLEQDIKDKLDEFKIAGGGNLSYEVFHMEGARVAQPESSEEAKENSLEEIVQEKGIVPFQVQSIEQDEVGIKLIYSAMSIAYKEKPEEIIPRVIPQELYNLEYNLVSKIYHMARDKKPVIALLAPYHEKKMNEQMLALLRQLGQQVESAYREDKFNVLEAMLKYEDYDVKRISLNEGDSIPENADTLIVAAPKELNERQRYEINRFLSEGGNVFIAAQEYDYNYNALPGRGIEIIPQKNSLGLNELLSNYGISINKKILMDENSEMLSVSGGANLGPFSVSTPVKVPIQIMVDQATMNQETSITGRLASLFYLWGSSLDINGDIIKSNNLDKTILFTSSKKSWLLDYHPGTLTNSDIQPKPGSKGLSPLAVLLEGQFPDTFKNKPIPDWPKSSDEKIPKTESIEEQKTKQVEPLNLKPGKLIVVGCSKMFEEEIIKASSGMLMFFMNSADALTLGGELVNIRSHQPVNRSIRNVSKAGKLWYRFLIIFLVPLIVVFAGILRFIWRRREKESYLKALVIDSGVGV